jgi:hypothetical protein
MDASKQRFEQEYFRIGCYGMGFHDFLQVKREFLFENIINCLC